MDIPITARTIESIARGDPLSPEVRVTQLTSAPGVHENIYHGQSFSDASGRYVLYLKGFAAFGDVEVWRYDMVDGVNERLMAGVMRWGGIGMCGDQRHFFCARMKSPEVIEWLRLDIIDLTMACYELRTPGPLSAGLCAVTPDAHQIIAAVIMPGHRYDIVRFDTRNGRCSVVFEGDGSLYSNPILSGDGRLCVQWNRGQRFDEHRRRAITPMHEQGATYLVFTADGGGPLELPAGKPHGPAIGGHHTWVSGGGGLLYNVVLPQSDPRASSLELLNPVDHARRVFVPGLQCVHPSASLDGRYFVADLLPDARLIVGSLKTGRFFTLCHTGATFARPQHTHPHPWFTPDGRHVVYTSDRTGVPHVYVASVPEQMLVELDQ